MFEWANESMQIYGTVLSYVLVIVFFILLILMFKGKLKLDVSHKHFLVLFGLVCFSFAIRLPFVWMNEVSYDEPLYISASLLYMEGFSEGLGSSKFMANFEHPPLVKYLLGAFLKICFPSAHLDYGSRLINFHLLLSARLFIAFIGAISIVPLYFIAEKISPCLGMAASIFFALNPSHARLSGLAYLDVPMIFFGLCAMLATLHLLEKTSLKTLILCGVAHALLLGTKWVQPILFIIPMLVFILLYHRKRISHYISACIIGLLILLVSWFPPIYQLGINLLFLISDHWSNQLHVTERSFLDMILWNVSAAEFALYIACLAVTTILLFSSLKKDGISSIPIISIYTILVMLFAEPRKAVYYGLQ